MPKRIRAARDAIERQAERLAISELMLDLIYTPEEPGLLHDPREKVIMHAIAVGTLRGKPLALSRIAQLVSMDRNTVRRHIALLIQRGMVEKYNDSFLLGEGGVGPTAIRIDDWSAAILRAAERLRSVQNEQVPNGRNV